MNIKNILIKLLLNTIVCVFIFGPQSGFSADNESLYKQGVEAFNSGNYGSAELIFARIVESRDDDFIDQAWFYQAKSIFFQKKYKAALYEFNRFLNRCTASERCIESRFWLGETYYYLADYVKSIEQYKRYILKVKNGELVTSAHDRIGSIYFTQKRYDEAIIEWEEAISKSNDRTSNALRLLHIGEALFKNNQFKESLNRLTPLLTAKNQIKITAMARLICGQIYQLLNDHKKALLLLNSIPGDLLKEAPFYEAQYFKGLSYQALGSENIAKSFFELFIHMGKDSALYFNAQLELGKILTKKSDWKKGVVLLEEVRKSADNPELRFQASKILSKVYMKHDPESAIPYLQESLTDENPEEHKEALLVLTKVYINIKDFNSAQKSISELIEKYPYDKRIDEALFLKAVISLEKGSIAEAIDLFEKIQKEFPFSTYVNESKFYLARVYFKNAKLKRARYYVNSYLKLKDIENKYEAYLLLIAIHNKMNNFKSSQATMNYVIKNFFKEKGVDYEIFSFATQLKENNLDPWPYYTVLMNKYPNSEYTINLYFSIANDHYSKNNYEKALYYYNKYLKDLNAPDRGTAYYNRLICLLNLKKFDILISDIQKSQIPPMNEKQWNDIPLLLSRSYYHKGNLEKVYNILYSSDLSKYQPHDLFIFIKSALHMGDFESARNSLPLIKINKDLYTSALFLMGKYKKEKEVYDEAISFYSALIEDYPGSDFFEQSKVELSEIYIALKQYDNAIKLLSNIKSKDLLPSKTAMTINIYFETGKIKDALSITKENITSLKKTDLGESVFKKNLVYYYNHDDYKEFSQFSKYLMAYKSSIDTAYYYSGKFNFKLKNFKTAYNYFSKLTRLNSGYKAEALYYAAIIQMNVYKKLNTSIWYLKKIIEDDTASESLILNSKINLAIIYKQYKKDDTVKYYLNDVLQSDNRGYLKSQAENLFDYFGYTR